MPHFLRAKSAASRPSRTDASETAGTSISESGITTVTGRRRGFVTSADATPHLLLLTATLTPPQGAVLRADPAVRLADYLESLKFYLSLPARVVDRILFVDNSGSDVALLCDAARTIEHDKLVQLISFNGNDHPPEYGKAFGEFRLLDFALTHTTLLAENEAFWKVTGRLRCLNLTNIISAVRRPYDLACDLHHVQTFGLGRFRLVPWMDLRLYGCTKAAYDAVFRGRGDLVRSRRAIYDQVSVARKTLRVVPRFYREPHFAGYSAVTNTPYDARTPQRLFRNVVRSTAPWIWL